MFEQVVIWIFLYWIGFCTWIWYTSPTNHFLFPWKGLIFAMCYLYQSYSSCLHNFLLHPVFHNHRKFLWWTFYFVWAFYFWPIHWWKEYPSVQHWIFLVSGLACIHWGYLLVPFISSFLINLVDAPLFVLVYLFLNYGW